MTTLTSLLVGAHFRPPAKCILAHLPQGASLILDPEPSNPYDENAIKVLVSPKQIPESEYAALEAELPDFGSSLEDIMRLAQGDEDHDQDGNRLLWLGYIAATGGKPLSQARAGLVGNEEVLALITGSDSGVEVKLSFGPGGEPEVEVEVLVQ